MPENIAPAENAQAIVGCLLKAESLLRDALGSMSRAKRYGSAEKPDGRTCTEMIGALDGALLVAFSQIVGTRVEWQRIAEARKG